MKLRSASAVAGLVCVLPACTYFERAQEEVEPYVATVATEVILLHVPTDELAGYGLDVPDTTLLLVALGEINAEAVTSDDPFTSALVGGAQVTVTSSDGTFTLSPYEDTPGYYALVSTDEPAFQYHVGETYQVDIAYGGEAFRVKLEATGAVTMSSPEQGAYQPPGQDLLVKWSPPSDAALALVYNAAGEQVYSNLPSDLNGLYTFLTGDPLSSLVVPGSAFAENQLSAVSLVGLTATEVDDTHFTSNLNALVSNAYSGEAAVRVVYSYVLP